MDWYYLRDGRTMGPVPEGSIRAWLESGFLQPEDLLWHAGMTQWLPAIEMAEFGGPGEPESNDGPDPGTWQGTSAAPQTDELRRLPGDTQPLAQTPGGVPADSRAPGFEPAGSPAGGPAGPADRGAGDPSNVGAAASGGAVASGGRAYPGASPWEHARAGWSAAPVSYAGVWARAGAAAVDLMLLLSVVLLLFRPELPTSGNIEEMAKLNPAITPVFMVLAWLYFGLLEGSAWQASLGKLAFGLKVTDLEGNRLLLGRALTRGLLKVVLMEITAFLSFLPAAFTARRQALHDMVAGSTVLVR